MAPTSSYQYETKEKARQRKARWRERQRLKLIDPQMAMNIFNMSGYKMVVTPWIVDEHGIPTRYVYRDD